MLSFHLDVYSICLLSIQKEVLYENTGFIPINTEAYKQLNSSITFWRTEECIWSEAFTSTAARKQVNGSVMAKNYKLNSVPAEKTTSCQSSGMKLELEFCLLFSLSTI